MTGDKHDKGKAGVGWLFKYFPRALKAVAEVSDFGALKYKRGGWLEVPDGLERYEDALGRHILDQYIEGDADEESGLLHKAHLAWNALATLELAISQKTTNNKLVDEAHALAKVKRNLNFR